MNGKNAELTDSLTIPVKWEKEPPLPQPANVLNVSRTPAGEVLVTFGFVAPLLSGDENAQLRAARALAKSGVRPEITGRVVLTPKVAQQLVDIMQGQINITES